MKVGIDLTCISRTFDGGKDQVIYNLLRGFKELGHEKDLVVFSYDFMRDALCALLPGASVKSFTRLRGKKLLQDLPLRTLLLPREVRAHGLDVLLFPKYYTGLRRLPIPTVVIPHDVQFRAFPDRFSRSLLLREHILYGLDFRLRDRIVAVSDFDADELRRYYPASSGKIVRIYNPICFEANARSDEPNPHGRPYLLAINIAYRHKNTLTLLRAFELLRERIAHDLLLVGKLEPWNLYLREYVEEHRLGDRVFFEGYVGEAKLRSLLHHSTIYVNPSVYEGFGMTPIEAMGAEVAVVSSRETALFETTLGLAEYYEPARDPGALAEKLLSVIERPPSRDVLARNRDAVRKSYDYRLIAQQYWELFTDLARPRSAA